MNLVIRNMVKNFVVNSSMNLIKDLNKYDKTQLEEIKYGIEAIYLTVSKIITILILTYILGLFKEAVMFLLIFNILRAFAFGLHASKSIWCWISSSISFIFIPYICKNFIFYDLVYIIVPIICLSCFLLYAPADTVKRPLINSKKRKIYKYLSITTGIIYLILIILLDNTLIKNLLMFSLVLETILILPITYKIFKLPYKNYLHYKN